MTFSTMIMRGRHKQIAQSILSGKRLDGRGLTDYREIKLVTGLIESAEGSARVYLGKTDVIVGIKIGIGEPFPDLPNKGVLTVNSEFRPIASPNFRAGPPGEKSIELSRVVDRGIRESNAVDLEKLCIIPGKKVFVIFIDISILNHDGNLIDASAIASLAALLNTKFSNYEVKNDEIKIKTGYTQLPVLNHPITVTVAKIEDKLVIDPSLEEERVIGARLTITVEDSGNICAIQKSGSDYFNKQLILEAVKLTNEKIGDLRKIIVED